MLTFWHSAQQHAANTATLEQNKQELCDKVYKLAKKNKNPDASAHNSIKQLCSPSQWVSFLARGTFWLPLVPQIIQQPSLFAATYSHKYLTEPAVLRWITVSAPLGVKYFTVYQLSVFREGRVGSGMLLTYGLTLIHVEKTAYFSY